MYQDVKYKLFRASQKLRRILTGVKKFMVPFVYLKKYTITRGPDAFIAISGFGDFDFKQSSIYGINGLKI
ncbi:hypothetical protein T01_13396 [Trichinella spiralis]|uniref:Uncharacterized protein n=1 Tax=Trichinella spiralis TaxID=6334 RepID=A0A0V1BED7_TRISP|nr:hypothetical protein T01_14863 [Trichinella spiralis]KRY35230.1 hypothetical protein T01_13396 [Trichinella spiralis]